MGQQRRTWASVVHITGQALGGSADLYKQSSGSKYKAGRSKTEAAAAEDSRSEGSLPFPSTFLFPCWGWEVIGNDSRIPFLPLL